ncbi:MAG TPA: SPOR domain-containing protein [Allosphingosinicella sp.]|jgi:Flp pilus assembly protein TadD
MRGALLGFAVLGAGMLSAGGPAIAQQTYGAPQETPGDALSRNLKTLVANPRSVDALTGAGRAALAVGDAQAALSFLARAEDEAPRDGRIKMWIASALVQLEQPHAALKFFKDAADLGVPEAEIAPDRGLAYDIAGDPRRAQRDYRLALQRSRDPELTRRLALSLAISGEREPALRLLDEQFQTRNPAADRTRALVLALTGDAADAARVVEASMPGPQGAALMPFLARLPSLSLADRALAVHLGHFPQDGRTAPASNYAMNSFRSNVVSMGAGAPSPVDAGRPDALQPGLGRSTAALVRAAPRDSADEEEAPPVRSQAIAPPVSPPAAADPSAVRRRPSGGGAPPAHASTAQPSSWSWSRPALPRTQPHSQETRIASATPTPLPSRAVNPAPQVPVIALPHPLDISRPGAAAASTRTADETTPPAAKPPAPHPSRLADLAATVRTLPTPVVPAKHDSTGYGPKIPTAAARKPVAAKKPEAKETSRHWVQLGIGDDEDSLPGEYARLKTKAGKLLSARTGWTAAMGETNRILVGPFASKDDAQEFVNELAEKKLRAFAWTSAVGEKVAKLPAK